MGRYPTEDGFVYVFLTNESASSNWVYFDDMVVKHTQGDLIMQADDYMPFGMTFNSYQRVTAQKNNFKYNGFEEQTALDWGVYDYLARYYDPQIGRFLQVDPAADIMRRHSTYNYAFDNPIRYIDPDGMAPDLSSIELTMTESMQFDASQSGPAAGGLESGGYFSTEVIDNGDGTYTVVGGDPNDGDNNIYVATAYGDGTYTRGAEAEVIGESLTSHSFFDANGDAVVGAVIDLNSTEGQDFIDNEIIAADPSVLEYKNNAGNGKNYDFKDRGIQNASDQGLTQDQHRYRGSVTSDGKIGSARDFGNVAAGIVTGRANLPYHLVRKQFDAFNGGPEPAVSVKAQEAGFKIGLKLYVQDGLNGKYD